MSLPAASSAAAQVIEYRAGSSSLYRAHGGSMILHWSGYTTRADFGVAARALVGLYLGFPFRRLTIGIGDQTMPFDLPTDRFAGSYLIPGRGASLSRRTAHSNFLVFGGATTTGLYTPYFQVARAEGATALLSYERTLGGSLQWISRTAVGEWQTVLNGLAWSPSPRISLGVATGIGGNDPYGAASLGLDLGWLAVRAGYTCAGSGFRRMPADPFARAESDGENLELQVAPVLGLALRASRRNFLPTGAADSGRVRATVTGAGISASALGFQLGGSLHLTERGTSRAQALALTASRRFGWLATAVGFYRSRPERHRAFETTVATFRETLSPRVGLTQVVTKSQGQATLTFGGRLLANRVAIDVDYQTVFLPLAVGRSQFRQALLLTARVPIARDLSLTATTRVNDAGDVGYTTYATGYAYARLPAARPSGAGRAALHQNVIRGRVMDERGRPVRGAALRVDGDLAFSDSEGLFLVRKKSAREYRFEVPLAEFMFPGTYEVVSAPGAVRAVAEGSAVPIEVVLRRVR